MPRKTKMNDLTSPELIAQVNPDNLRLLDDFINYLHSTQRAETTIFVYKNNIEIAFVWGLQHNRNKFFTEWTKRDVVSLQNWLINTNGNSPSRVRHIKAALSSLSNYIENICDDEYPNFRNIINKVENPVNQPVREKTVLSEEQLNSLLDTLVQKKKYDKACMLALAMCSGRRKSELVRFKVSYFDDKNIMFGSLYRTPEKIKTKGRGNGKYIYCYTLSKQFKPYFDLWMKYRAENNIESEWLFPLKSDPTKHLKAETLNSWSISFSKLLNVDFYWHSLRHYMTTYLSRMGIPDSVIAEIISWESVDMVNVYKDISVEENLQQYFGDNKRNTTNLSDL